VLFGAGGNIGLSYGEDGNAIVDDQFAPLTDKIWLRRERRSRIRSASSSTPIGISTIPAATRVSGSAVR
jgi:hypothetical protein